MNRCIESSLAIEIVRLAPPFVRDQLKLVAVELMSRLRQQSVRVVEWSAA
jgi:hypothetical protein